MILARERRNRRIRGISCDRVKIRNLFACQNFFQQRKFSPRERLSPHPGWKFYGVLAVFRKLPGESVCTIDELRRSCSRSSVTNSAANNAAEAKNTESAPRSLCCAPSAAACRAKPASKATRTVLGSCPIASAYCCAKAAAVPVRLSAAATSAINSVGRNNRGRDSRTHSRKLALSALPISDRRAALTNTLESMVSSRTLPSYLPELNNCRLLLLRRLRLQPVNQHLPSIPCIVPVGLIQ
jgi:hypothetical protein